MLKLIIVALSVCVAMAAVAKKDRTVDHKLSDKTPGSQEYDNEAFLGTEEVQTFKDLTPEETKERLGKIVDKIDKDNDGNVTEEELTEWILFTQRRYIREDAEKQFPVNDKDNDGKVHWEEYKKAQYAFLEDENIQHETGDGFSYQQMIERDERRWDKADRDGDKACNIDEFISFLHPEEFEHMREVVIKETLEDIDKNKDGFVDLEEYIGDMYNADSDGEEPEWVATEKTQFTEYRDENKDGKLDFDEVKRWIMPEDYNHAEAEAKHLIYESDDDKDGTLTKEEILEHHEKFVGSQATDWGEALTRHDEF